MRGAVRAVLALALALGPAASRAQPGDAADAHFDAGVRLFEQERFEEALREFEQARELRETASVVLNVANCLHALSRYAGALEQYERFLEIASPRRMSSERAVAYRAVSELRRHVTELTIEATVPNADLFMNGDPVSRQPLRVDVGAQLAIEARHEGYLSARASVHASAPGPMVVTLRLEPVGSEREGRPLEVRGARRFDSSARDFVPRSRSTTPERSRKAPWLFIVAGSAALAAGVATLVWIFARPEPVEGDWTLRGP